MMTEIDMENEEQKLPEQEPEQKVSLSHALKSCRIAANLSVEDIAQKLNLKESVILNLEDDLAHLIADEVYPLIYLRGYLISYCKELDFPDVESYSEFQKLNHPSEFVTSLKNPYIFSDKKKLSKKILWTSLLLFIITLSVIAYYSKVPENAKSAIEQIVTENIVMDLSMDDEDKIKIIDDQGAFINSDESDADSDDYIPLPDIDPKKEAPVVEEENEPLVSVESTTIVMPNVVEPKVVEQKEVVKTALNIDNTEQSEVIDTHSLKLTFEGECWAVITDAKGNRLAFGLYKEGRELALSGIPPFNLKLGNPTAVNIFYQDKLIERNFVEGKIANFTLPE